MTEKAKKPKETSEEEVKIAVSLGGLFKGVGNLIDLVAKMMEEGEGEIKRTGKIEGLPHQMKGVYGMTIRSGIGGIPAVERFGNIRETEKGPVVEEIREPIVDVFNEEGKVLVVVELPGVDKSDIHLAVKDGLLVLKAQNKERKYSKEISLPVLVDSESLSFSYKNGILEVTLSKTAQS